MSFLLDFSSHSSCEKCEKRLDLAKLPPWVWRLQFLSKNILLSPATVSQSDTEVQCLGSLNVKGCQKEHTSVELATFCLVTTKSKAPSRIYTWMLIHMNICSPVILCFFISVLHLLYHMHAQLMHRDCDCSGMDSYILDCRSLWLRAAVWLICT